MRCDTTLHPPLQCYQSFTALYSLATMCEILWLWQPRLMWRRGDLGIAPVNHPVAHDFVDQFPIGNSDLLKDKLGNTARYVFEFPRAAPIQT